MAKKKSSVPIEILKEGRKRFTNDTVAKKKRRLRWAEKHPFLFGIIYLPHYFWCKSAPFHKVILKAVLEFSRVVIAAPRGHAKSVILSLVFPLWCICFNKMKFIVINSDTYTQAAFHGDNIKKELEENEKIRNDFGNLVGRWKWSEKEFVTRNGIKILCIGTGTKIRGLRYLFARPDLVICDDPEDDEAVNNPERRKKTEDWDKRKLSNIVDPNKGKIIKIGTIIHYDCLLKKNLKNPAYKSFFFKAIQDDGTALWEALWPLEKLEEKKKEIGSLAFEAEYQNNPIDPDTQIFKMEWIETTYYEDKDIEGIPMDYYAGVDPAITEKETADYTAIITIGIARGGEYDGHIFVIDPCMVRISPKKIIDVLFQKFRQFDHELIGIEVNAAQQYLNDWIEDKSTKERVYLRKTEIDNRGGKDRIIRLSPLFEQGIIHLRREHHLLIHQLIEFPKANHDDGPDALEMAVRIARGYTKFFEHIEEPVEEGTFMVA